MDKQILLIGLGPHSKRIYLTGLKRLKATPTLIIDLRSKKSEIESYLKKESLNSEVYFIPDEERDAQALSKEVEDDLDILTKKHKITHAILSTEPKAHFGYLKYLITRKIPVLTDKPITAPLNVSNDEEQAKKIHSEYYHLLSLLEEYQTRVIVQCQRRYDKRYEWILHQIQMVMEEYQLPISHIQITHCDGSWNMPNEFFSRENHPYKYGYGKLFHSGYHFIDLAALLLSYDHLPPKKKPTDCFVTSIHYSPHDQLFALDETFYLRSLKEFGYSSFYENWRQNQYLEMGELDILALFEFSRDSHVITTCSLNLLQSGFSRRAWAHLPADNYKGNGRVRHEMLSLQIGPLINIQVHSYQAHEIKERFNKSIDPISPGGLEHFDIHIFKNSDILGGVPHEIIKGYDLYSDQIESEYFIGYNENARYECLSNFINNYEDNRSTLQMQKLTIDMVTHAYISMCRRRSQEAPISKFKINHFSNRDESIHDPAKFYSSIYSRS